MNERIRELAEQARDWAEVSYKNQCDQFTSHWDTPIGYTPTQFFEQKFAELIVAECATAIINDRRLNDVRSAANGCVRTIKEHFGVEE